MTTEAGNAPTPDLHPNEAEAVSSFDALSNPELTQHYLVERAQFRSLVDRCERASRGAGGILATSNRIAWGAILFTRFVVTGKSVNRLLPDARRGEHWDFSATASITRNLLEALLTYEWLCGSAVPDEVREGRVVLLICTTTAPVAVCFKIKQ